MKKDNLSELKTKPNNIIINDNTYINPKNMYELICKIKDEKKVQSILLTPYLVSKNKNSVYELHYYEFDIEVSPGKKIIKSYNNTNSLSKNITENLVPGIEVDETEYELVCKYLKVYLDTMSTFSFEDERKDAVELKDASLYYQIF